MKNLASRLVTICACVALVALIACSPSCSKDDKAASDASAQTDARDSQGEALDALPDAGADSSPAETSDSSSEGTDR